MPPANSPVRDPSRLAVSCLLDSRSPWSGLILTKPNQPSQPARSVTRTPSPATLLPVLRDLGTPVPDLASTLTIQAENDIDAENVSFLRSPSAGSDIARNLASMSQPSQDDLRRRRFHIQRQPSRSSEPRREEESREQRQMRDWLVNHRYAFDAALADGGRQSTGRSPYGERAPNQQSLYDWAPATEEGEEEELEEILNDLREQQPHTHPDVLLDLGRTRLESQQEQRRLALARTPANTHPAPHEQSLRSAAILRSVRTNRGLSARSRDLMQRYVMDRERELDSRSRSNSSSWFRIAAEANAAVTNSESSAAPDTTDRSSAERDREERRRARRAVLQQRDYIPTIQQQREEAASRQQRTRENMTAEAANLTADLAAPSTTGRSRSGETMESLRRRYLEDPSSPPNKFANSIRLLDWLRNPECDVEDLQRSMAKEKLEQQGRNPVIPDFAKLSRGLPPPPTSWLQPGMVFSGSQHAAASSSTVSTTLYRLANNQTTSTTNMGPPPPGTTNSLPPGVPGSSMGSGNSGGGGGGGAGSTAQKDRWAVRVSIHSVDYENMTLQGTMEAFDVPSILPSAATAAAAAAASVPYRSSTSALRSTIASAAELATSTGASTAAAPSLPLPDTTTTTTSPSTTPPRPPSTFTTYLEGELVDLRQHSLATESYKAEPVDDAKYWRRLEPFARMHDLALAKAALDPAWLVAELRDKYVLMRWKERCFVRECMVGERERGASAAGDASGGGGGGGGNAGGFGMLSINGFYYLSMRRADGHIEGLYFDPGSSPYQHLALAPEGPRGRGAWEFA